MIEAYRIGVSLVMDSNVGRELSVLQRQFEMFQRILQRTQGTVNELASGMRALTRLGRGAAEAWQQAAVAMERAASATSRAGRAMPAAPAGPGTGFTLQGDSYGPAPPSAQRGRRGPVVPFGPNGVPLPPGANPYAGGELVPDGHRFGPNGPIPLPPLARPPARPSHYEFGLATMGYGLVGAGLTGFAGAVFNAGADVGHVEYQLRAQGYSEEQIKQALGVAKGAQRDILGVTVGGALTAQLDLNTILRNPEKAAKLAPDLMRMAVVLAASGKGDQLSQFFKAAQAGELKGMIHSPEEFAHFLHMIEATSITTGGRIGPAEILQFIRSGGAAAMGLGDDTMFGYAIPAILSQGAARAGTGFRGFYQQFSAGKMSESAQTMLIDLGLVADKSKFQRTPIGMYRALPGALVHQDLLQQGKLFEYIRDVLLPKIKAYDIAHYGYDDVNLESQTGFQLASRIPGGNLLADLFRLLPLSEGYQAAVKASSERDAFATRVATDPTLKVQGLQAAWNGFLVSLANGPVMDAATKVLKDLTGGLNALGEFADKHPTVAKTTVELAAGLGALATAIAVAAGALWLGGPMLRVGKWAAGAATAAATGSEVAGGVAAGWGLGALTRVGAGRLAWPIALGAMAWDWNPFGLNDMTWSPLDPFHIGQASAAPVGGQHTVNLTGDVHMDGQRVGTVVANNHADQAARPPAGPTTPDVRLNMPMPGMNPFVPF